MKVIVYTLTQCKGVIKMLANQETPVKHASK